MENHKLSSNVETFIKAGKAIFTIENPATGNRFTYQVSRCNDPQKGLWFVAVLSGPNNISDYQYIGTFFGDTFRRTGKS
jgi:hypothetical protein